VRYLVPVGRVLYSAIFLMTIFGHFSQGYIGYATQQGVPAAGLLVPLSGIIAIAGALSIALGFKAKIGAWLERIKSLPGWVHPYELMPGHPLTQAA
jgi:putative oxidoreductase